MPFERNRIPSANRILEDTTISRLNEALSDWFIHWLPFTLFPLHPVRLLLILLLFRGLRRSMAYSFLLSPAKGIEARHDRRAEDCFSYFSYVSGVQFWPISRVAKTLKEWYPSQLVKGNGLSGDLRAKWIFFHDLSRRTIKLSRSDLPKYRDITAKGITVRWLIYYLAPARPLCNCRGSKAKQAASQSERLQFL